MKSLPLTVAVVVFSTAVALAGAPAPAGAVKPPASAAWAVNATIIEACSCPMFCQCYFATEPASHAGHMEGHEGHAETYCRFNNAYKVNRGTYNGVSLAGARFWIAGDLGASFANGSTDW